MAQLTATDALESEADALQDEMKITAELIRQAITQNASMAIDPEEYERRYSSLSERIEKDAARSNAIKAEVAQCKMKRDMMATFAKALMADATEFTPELWNTLVDQAQVSPDGEIRFTFKNGAEIIV